MAKKHRKAVPHYRTHDPARGPFDPITPRGHSRGEWQAKDKRAAERVAQTPVRLSRHDQGLTGELEAA